MLALIDGDIVRYRTGFASNDVNEAIACSRANETIEQILEATKATTYQVYLSDSKENNFRYKIYPRYKESREKYPKPKHHDALGWFLKEEWNAKVSEGQEADDALGIDQTAAYEYAFDGREPTVICSIDKDLLQVPGKHYNWVRDEWLEQDYTEGMRCFFIQCLTGDRTDDIHGIQGIGIKKATKALAGTNSVEGMAETVRKMWMNDEALQLVGSLLWVRRYPNEEWKLSSFIPDMIQESPYSWKMLRGIDPLLVRGGQEVTGAPEAGSETENIETIPFPPLTW